MKVLGIESIQHEISAEAYFVKCVVNAATAVFFSGTIQHRDVKHGGVSYEDDYMGNALAVTITPGVIDIRFHKAYSDENVREIFRTLLSHSKLSWAFGFSVRYQGRTLIPSSL